MNKFIFVFSILFISVNLPAFANGSEQVLTLKDGSQIKGELSGVTNGVYTIKTPIIGEVHVAASDVASITNGAGTSAPIAALPASTSPSSSSSMDQQIMASQQQLMSNPQSMQILQQMTENPEIVKALQDPALVQAVTNHDYAAIQSNPAIQKLMSNPQMQELLQKLAAQQGQQNTPSQ